MSSDFILSVLNGSSPYTLHGSIDLESLLDHEIVALCGEQTNSSYRIGDTLWKVYATAIPGLSPEVELGRHIHAYTAEVLDWISDDSHTLAVITRFIDHAADCWRIADNLTNSEITHLWHAVASVHKDLHNAFGVKEKAITAIAANWRQRFDDFTTQLPTLEKFRDSAHHVYDYCERSFSTITTTRIHGDLHLGQILKNDTGFFIIDFEGEPGAASAHHFDSPLRDIAGLIRSFHYADINVAIPDVDKPELLNAYLIDRFLYEVVYEHNHRPEWVTKAINSGRFIPALATAFPDPVV
ncbi:putative trehalose synthase [Corynebacterium kutscheri]|uniref:phosphotransferase n=1 Tax=Corynebacterium kutscheri TaxID=35755 RepID=UPI000F6BC5C8|nr:phosphotransferase [Corynebacterium kutscheri]VEH79320.1 putative trehalose synthase [Corynebacterium kutscheri]